jgi:hypothetical protein
MVAQVVAMSLTLTACGAWANRTTRAAIPCDTGIR